MSLEPNLLLRPIPETYWVLPGQFLAGEYPGTSYFPEQTRKRLNAFLDDGFNTFFDLTRPGEVEPYDELLRESAAEYGLQVQYSRLPIGDFGLPSVAEMQYTLDALAGRLAAGRKLYLHCYGGIGRTGTVVGCYLVRQGLSGSAALRQLSEWWQTVPKASRFPHSPETRQQAQFILDWADHVAGNQGHA